ncbi:hypothetical protein UFOVP724_103 [uncultured Caudovirales phage]|jgi:hypothetical protein|uniref:Uncharacterized protein n=1 Tax=uncultured Caudovirales phage TaxID=2100421 RepID=A0A6J5NSV3_9CAUD|nr:hypothetical protein UFOVP724_103 [uncultured Caudovirales phage]
MNEEQDLIECFIEKLPENPSDKKEMPFFKMIMISFTLSFLGDMTGSFDHYAVTHDWIITQIFSGLVTSAIWTTNGILLMGMDTTKERIKFSICNALGYTTGSTVMLLYIKPLFA